MPISFFFSSFNNNNKQRKRNPRKVPCFFLFFTLKANKALFLFSLFLMLLQPVAHSLHLKSSETKTHSSVEANRSGQPPKKKKRTSTTRSPSRRGAKSPKNPPAEPRHYVSVSFLNKPGGGGFFFSFCSKVSFHPPSSSASSALKQFSFFLDAGQVAQTAGVSAQLPKLSLTHTHTLRQHTHFLKLFKTSTPPPPLRPPWPIFEGERGVGG